MSVHAITVAPAAFGRAKPRREVFPIVEDLRQQSAAVMKEAFPGNLKRFVLPLLPISTLSKARQGYSCNPAFRLTLCVVSLWAGGAPRERAQILADHVQDTVDRLYPTATGDPRQLSLLETRWEGFANPLQMAFQAGDDSVCADLVMALRRHRAGISSLIQALLSRPADRQAA